MESLSAPLLRLSNPVAASAAVLGTGTSIGGVGAPTPHAASVNVAAGSHIAGRGNLTPIMGTSRNERSRTNLPVTHASCGGAVRGPDTGIPLKATQVRCSPESRARVGTRRPRFRSGRPDLKPRSFTDRQPPLAYPA